MLNWSRRFNIFCLLDNCGYSHSFGNFEGLLAVGAIHQLVASSGNAFDQLTDFSNQHDDWLFGHFSYDLKNELEGLTSAHSDPLAFPDLHFFIPESIISLQDAAIHIHVETAEQADTIYQQILNSDSFVLMKEQTGLNLRPKIDRETYFQKVKQIQAHIARGDCYEINFCQEFFDEHASIDPFILFYRLIQESPNPFSCFYRFNERYCLCASPERYLSRKGNKIFSQPIKGTAARIKNNSELDAQNKNQLSNSKKDLSENVMIVDLVRNDLSKVCERGSVKADELFGIYDFPQVFQMISTISGQVSESLHWLEAIKATFPMGSMTGAPKKRVMELIERYEESHRGLYSGAIGYAMPWAKQNRNVRNFDFNVVIRSLFYNSDKKYLSYQVGSALTTYCNPELEYEECLVKAAGIKKVLAEYRDSQP